MELLAALRKRRIRSSLGALCRFFEPHNITFKRPAGDGRTCLGVGTQGPLEPAHLVFIDETPTRSKRQAQPLAICPRIRSAN
jgi:hypothetical protein